MKKRIAALFMIAFFIIPTINTNFVFADNDNEQTVSEQSFSEQVVVSDTEDEQKSGPNSDEGFEPDEPHVSGYYSDVNSYSEGAAENCVYYPDVELFAVPGEFSVDYTKKSNNDLMITWGDSTNAAYYEVTVQNNATGAYVHQSTYTYYYTSGGLWLDDIPGGTYTITITAWSSDGHFRKYWWDSVYFHTHSYSYATEHPHYYTCSMCSRSTSSTTKSYDCTTCYPPYVYYRANGGSGEPYSQSGYPITVSSTIPVYFPYMFRCWNTSPTGSQTNWYPGETMYNSAGSSTYLYAIWDNPIELSAGEHSTSSTYIGSKGATAYFRFVPPKTATYAFESTTETDTMGYLYDSNGNELAFNDDGGVGNNFRITHELTEGTTYYFGAKFYSTSMTGTLSVEMNRQYSIFYDPNGGVGAPLPQSARYGESITLSTGEPTREGGSFLGWATTPGASEPEYYPGASCTLNADLTLYAIWDMPTYTITFDANTGNGAPSPMKKSYGEAITLPVDIPTKSGNTFLGWASSPDALSPEYAPGSLFYMNQDCTLYAIWLENAYAGTPVINVEDGYNKKTVIMSSATQNATIYYTIDGSDPATNGRVYVKPIDVMIEGVITFKAIAVAEGYNNSGVSERSVELKRLRTPIASVMSGNLKPGTEVTLSGEGELFYSINNGEDQPYISPIVIDGDTKIIIYSRSIGYLNSRKVEYSYTTNIERNGTIGGVVWNFDNGELVITGSGAIPDFDKEEAPWYPLCDEIVKVKVEKSITTIGKNAFYGLERLAEVTLPDTVIQINGSAFEGCVSLEKIDLPVNMTGGIGENAFKDCVKLNPVVVPAGVSTIGKGAFKGCEALREITVPFIGSQVGSANNTDTFDYIFSGSVPSSLIKVTVTKETDVPENAFANLANLQYISVNSGVRTIGNGAFDGCAALKEFIVPNGITELGDNTFRGCSSAAVIDIPDTVQSFGEALFDGCAKVLAINVPNGISAINKDTFRNCSSLAEITIPNSVTVIDSGILSGCVSLRVINVPFVGANANPGISSETMETKFGYLFGTENNAIPASVTRVEVTGTDRSNYIPPQAFKDCGNIEDIIIDGGRSILDNAFVNCKLLKHLYIPRSVNNMGKEILAGCTQLNTLTVPFIGDNRRDNNSETSLLGAFFGYDNDIAHSTLQYYNNNTEKHYYKIPKTLKSVTILNQTDIPVGAFMNCDFLEKVSIVTGANMGENAFYNCSELKEVSLPNDLQNIGEQAFAECESLEIVNIPIKAKTIGSQVFYDARNLKNVSMPRSIDNIADDVFNGTNLYDDSVDLFYAGVITCSDGSYAHEYANEHKIATNLVDEEKLNIKKTSTTVNLLSDNSYLFDITDTNTLAGTLNVELYNENSQLINKKTQEANDVEYRISFASREMKNVSYAKVYVTDSEGKRVTSEDEILTAEKGEIPALPDVNIAINYNNGVVTFTGSTYLNSALVLIQAIYKDGALDRMERYNVTNLNDPIEIDTDFEPGSMKLMLWDDFQYITPLAEYIEK